MSRLMGYVDALANGIGPRPAATDSEYRAAEWIRERMEEHGVTASLEEFETPRTYSWAYVVYHATTIVAAVVSGLFTWAAIPALILALASAVLLAMDLDTRWGLTRLMPKGPSQNVVAKHVPRAARSERSRKIVIVAHYDSARSSLAFAPSMVAGFPTTFALMKWCTWLVPVAILAGIVLPGSADPWIWYATMAISAYLIVPLVIDIHRELFMGFVDGANDNASGVAALLGILDRVLPLEGDEEEEPDTLPLFGPEVLQEEDVVPEGAELIYDEEPANTGAVMPETHLEDEPRLPGIDQPRAWESAAVPAAARVPAEEAVQLTLPEVDEDLGRTRPFTPVAPSERPAVPSFRITGSELSELDLEALLPPIEPVVEPEGAHHAETWSADTHLEPSLAEEFTPIPESRVHEFAERVTGMFKRITPRKKARPEHEGDVSDWLGVEDFDARTNGAEIGTWDNFDDDAGFKGGATGMVFGEVGAETVSQTVSRIREQVMSVTDRDLREKEIWFVATGAEEVGTVGMQAFLKEHASELNGALIVNLDNIGAGSLHWVTAEGMLIRRRSDRRLQSLVRRVSRRLSIDIAPTVFRGLSTDASTALARGYSALTIIGLDGAVPANWHWNSDVVEHVEEANVRDVVTLVAEMIRES